MRDILFRGKRVDNGEWVYGLLYTLVYSLYTKSPMASYISVEERGSAFGVGYGNVCYAVNPDTVGQYTGLTDKNGKRVYDADVVRIDGGRICKVYWFSSPSHCGWDLKALNCCGNPPNASTLWGNLEVIGNIYDNQDLLSIYQEGNEC